MKVWRIAPVVALLFLLFLSTTAIFAQTVTGTITGTVTDPSGAVVSGATVTAENTATGVKTTAVTNGAGIYTIRFLQVGDYTVTVQAKGFSASNITGITLEIDQIATVDVGLKISASSSVSVQGTAHPILDTEDVSLGTTLSPTEIENIPLNGRNFSSLTLFVPGAVDTDPSGLTGNNAIERSTYNNDIVSINGNRQQANNYTIEGADNNEPQNNLIAYNIAPDAVGELRVVTGNANATYGNGNGGTIVAAIKSGTNSFHGSAYEFLESQIFDANTWSNNFQGNKKNPYTQNIFGGTFGGPIIKNKLFFFADYEGVRHHTGGTASASLLTPDMLEGNFSALTATGKQLYDSQNNFAPYLNNQIPVNNPVAQFLAANPALYPAPNSPPTDGLIANNFRGAQSSFVSNNQGDIKVDWTPTEKDRLDGFYSMGEGSDFTTALIPVFFPAFNTYPTKIFGISYVHTFSSTIVNEFRAGFTRVKWTTACQATPPACSALRATRKSESLFRAISSTKASPGKASKTIPPATSAPTRTRRSSLTTRSTTKTT